MATLSLDTLRKARFLFSGFVCFFNTARAPDHTPHSLSPTLHPQTQRAEHNDGALATVTELSLHQLHAIDVGPLSRVARRVTRLSLASNALPRVPSLPQMKELTELNLALNAIVRVTVKEKEGLGGAGR